MKKCCKCKSEQPVANFYREKKKADGLSARCKDCDRKKNQSRSSLKQREYNSRSYSKHKEKRLAYAKAYASANRSAVNEKAKVRYRADLETSRRECREYAAKNRAAIRAGVRRRKYGITDLEFGAMKSAQDFRCAICREPFGTPTAKVTYVDHNHATGAVRGLLCGPCNLGLGQFKDSPERLRLAAAYLEARP